MLQQTKIHYIKSQGKTKLLTAVNNIKLKIKEKEETEIRGLTALVTFNL